MPFESFKSLLEAVRKDYAWIEQMSDMLHTDVLYERLFSPAAIMNFLCQQFHDEENDWIGYFAFELDWGEKYTPGKVKDQDGNEIPLATYEDLYVLLVNNMRGE